MRKGQNYNHPKKGSIIRVDPIRDLSDIKQVKELLAGNPLHYCLFILGINTNLRASDLLSIRVDQVKDLAPMDEIVLREKKTGKERRVALNWGCIEAIQGLLKWGRRERWISEDPFDEQWEYLFAGKNGVMVVPSVSLLVKGWCRRVGLKENYGAHTLRKTWAFQQYVEFGVPIPTLMKCLNHSSEKQVLAYIGITEAEVKEVYGNEL
jgi:integrase